MTRMSPVQSGSELEHHEVLRIVEPSAALVGHDTRPLRADRVRGSIGLAALPAQWRRRSRARADRVDVDEQLRLGERGRNPVGQATRGVLSVAPAIADEDHGPMPGANGLSVTVDRCQPVAILLTRPWAELGRFQSAG